MKYTEEEIRTFIKDEIKINNQIMNVSIRDVNSNILNIRYTNIKK